MRKLPLLTLLVLTISPFAYASSDMRCTRVAGDSGPYDSLEIRYLPSLTKDVEVTFVAGAEKTVATGSWKLVGGHGMVDTYRYEVGIPGSFDPAIVTVVFMPFSPVTGTLVRRGQPDSQFLCKGLE